MADILLAPEAEARIKSLQIFDVASVGSTRWLQQHEHLVKLSMQAVKSVISREDEFIKEFFISYDKITVLIHELICIEVWKEKVFYQLIEDRFEPTSNIFLYTVLYHEVTLVTLLEAFLYYEEAVECISSVVIDLLDYCARKLTWLCSCYNKNKAFTESETKSGMDDLIKQENVLNFEISMKVLSVVGFLTEHYSVLPLSTLHRLLSTHDFPIFLITILEMKPWLQSHSNEKCKKYFEGKWIEVDAEERLKLTKTEGQVINIYSKTCINWNCMVPNISFSLADLHFKGLPLSTLHRLLSTHDFPIFLITILEMKPWLQSHSNEKCKKYFEGKWIEVDAEERLKLTKTEGQIWIGLFHLLLDDDCKRKYIINNYRKNKILKLQNYLNDIIIDQIPVLEQLQRYLYYLSISDPPQGKSEVIIEQISEIRESLLNKGKEKWKNIANIQAVKFFSPAQKEMMDVTKRLLELYDLDIMESLQSSSSKCATCGNTAKKRCSRCGTQWYCRRECQVKDWPKHKNVCKVSEKET
ncbi:zinc finger MYND domain-containing protein 10-like [Centruroides sculpturatus]|uniref:zinc finger MYND domain-containing protein 10-like n=1 Tax=Centruroides sculpturatus TaxID=218467 RepID=UPI000C6EDE73|nr:zinc finger MYND domain-containing protein 10-like [Centruroides sculpturatus]